MAVKESGCILNTIYWTGIGIEYSCSHSGMRNLAALNPTRRPRVSSARIDKLSLTVLSSRAYLRCTTAYTSSRIRITEKSPKSYLVQVHYVCACGYNIVNTTPVSSARRRYGFVVVGLWPGVRRPAALGRRTGDGPAGAWERTVSFRELSRLSSAVFVLVVVVVFFVPAVLAVVVGDLRRGGGGRVRPPNFNKRIGCGGGISSCSPRAPYIIVLTHRLRRRRRARPVNTKCAMCADGAAAVTGARVRLLY